MRLPATSRAWQLVLIALAAAVFAVRMTAPADFESKSQPRNVGYALDLIEHGNWLIQYDLNHDIMSKPPLHSWLVGILATPFGLNRVTLVLPSFFAVVGIALLVFEIGKRRFGLLAGGMAGLSVILAPILWKHVGLVRSDAVFTLFVAMGAWSAFRAWETGSGWTSFWLCGALATLTKGPLGLVLSAAGLLAWFWENRTHRPAMKPRGSHWAGVALFFAVCLGWIVPALRADGHALIEKMIYSELLGHVVSGAEDKIGGRRLLLIFEPTIDLIGRFFPFSVMAFSGMFRAIAKPAEDVTSRKLERFLTCWFLLGLSLFSLAAHQRTDLLLPLWPAAALLSGREIARLVNRLRPLTAAWATALGCALMIGTEIWIYHPPGGKFGIGVTESESVRQAAAAFAMTGRDPREIQYLGSPDTFQYYLETANFTLLPQAILEKHRGGENPMLVATKGDPLDPLSYGTANVTEVFRWPMVPARPPIVRIFELKW